jgi:16S rRNA (guanine527-N7)-methyltransferase
MTVDASDDSPAQWQRALRDGAADLGITIAPESADAFRVHFEMLLLHNPRAGLTAITDPVEIAIKHFLDSLAGLLVREISPGERVADVGSGGGFPGAVFAAARPQARYTLIESNQRRAAFLRALADALALRNTTMIGERAERVGRDPDHRSSYDLVLSRAVAPLPVVLEYCLPLAAIGGDLLAYKGPEAEREVAESADALPELGGRVTGLRRLTLPQRMGERVLVLIQKVSPTPHRYPRRPGIPAKRPL